MYYFYCSSSIEVIFFFNNNFIRERYFINDEKLVYARNILKKFQFSTIIETSKSLKKKKKWILVHQEGEFVTISSQRP